jgi:hypothetical protein
VSKGKNIPLFFFFLFFSITPYHTYPLRDICMGYGVGKGVGRERAVISITK